MNNFFRSTNTNLIHGLERITPARLYLLCVVSTLIVLHGAFPKLFAVDAITLALLGISIVIIVIPLLESAKFAGASIQLRQDLYDVTKLSDRAVKELTVKSAEIRTTSAQILAEAAPSTLETAGGSTFESTLAEEVNVERDKILEDPIIADISNEALMSPLGGLISLSAQLERAVRELLVATDQGSRRYYVTLKAGVNRLVEKGLLTENTASALALFSTVRNEIVHGAKRPSDDEVLRALDAGIRLYTALMAIPREP